MEKKRYQILYYVESDGAYYCRETVWAEDEPEACRKAEALRDYYASNNPPLTFKLEQW